MAICARYGEGSQASAELIRADLGGNTLALEYMLDMACDARLAGSAAIALREWAALFLRYMSEDDGNKKKFATKDRLSRLVTLLAENTARTLDHTKFKP